MSDKIVISPTSRQEGHAELVMEIDDEGIVTKGRYFSITPVRGLEKMVTGKAPETVFVKESVGYVQYLIQWHLLKQWMTL